MELGTNLSLVTQRYEMTAVNYFSYKLLAKKEKLEFINSDLHLISTSSHYGLPIHRQMIFNPQDLTMVHFFWKVKWGGGEFPHLILLETNGSQFNKHTRMEHFKCYLECA